MLEHQQKKQKMTTGSQGTAIVGSAASAATIKTAVVQEETKVIQEETKVTQGCVSDETFSVLKNF